METEKVKMPGALYEYTSQEAFNVPIFRFVGQEGQFTIINNLKSTQVSFPIIALDSLIKQLQGYQEYLKKFKEGSQKSEECT